MAGEVRINESPWSQDMRLPLESSNRLSRLPGEAASGLQAGDANASSEESLSGSACASQLLPFSDSLGLDACTARRCRSWEGSCAPTDNSEEQLNPRASSPGNPPRPSPCSLDGGHGVQPVSPGDAHPSAARPSSRATAYQSEAKRSAAPHVCCRCCHTLTIRNTLS